MQKNFEITRRKVLSAVSTIPIAPLAASASMADVKLMALGRTFDKLAAQVDEYRFNIDVLDQLERVEAEIVDIRATSLHGMRVKARAACWALLGDFDAGDLSTTDKRMALSIVRDLIRLYDA